MSPVAKSKIEWTDSTWSPVTGCTEVSEGCDHCYAKTFAERWRGVPGHPYEQGFDLRLWPERLEVPLHWRKPRRVFVNSMSDLFHKGVPDEFIAEVFAVMALARTHMFQCLTKRPGRMASLLGSDRFRALLERRLCWRLHAREIPEHWDWWPLPNVWLGTSVESQKWADVRVPLLAKCSAARLFLSCEPLLEAVTLDPERLGGPWARANAHSHRHPRHILGPVTDPDDGWSGHMACDDDGTGDPFVDDPRGCGFDTTSGGGIGWVIVGGESGPGARPMDPAWARSLVRQCREAGVRPFVKQLGSVWARGHGGNSKGGDPERWPADLRVREYPEVAARG